jgi:hypothetical protein
MLAVVVTAVVCCGCGNQYLKQAPPTAELCGNWRIDLARTKWKEAAPFLKGRSLPGRLSLRSDGTFSFKEMPDFSVAGFCTFTPTFRYHGTGKWWTDTSISDGTAYLSLNMEVLDGKQQQHTAGIAHFHREGGECFLCFTIRDPDSDQVLIMRKVEDQPTQSEQ